MKIIGKYVIPVVIIVILVWLGVGQFDSLFNKDAVKKEIIVIDPKVKVGEKVIDFSRSEELLTVAELVSATGNVLRNWNYPPPNMGNWYDAYINEAQKASWIIAGDYQQADYEKMITKGEAVKFFIRILESQGEGQYPLEISFYHDVIENLGVNVPGDMKEFLVKAYSKGLFPEEITNYNSNDYITKEEAFYLLDRIVNQGKRSAPVLLFPSINAELLVSRFQPPQGIYFAKDSLETRIEIRNKKKEQEEYWVGLSFQDAAGKWYDIPAEQVVLRGETHNELTLTWKVPEKIMSGHYRTVMAVWDRRPGLKGAQRLAYGESINMFLLYNNQEDFQSLKKDSWKTSLFTLGRSDFKHGNVSVDKGRLKFFMPANTFASGELQSVDLKGYGSYEIRMQLPDAPGSITGFFMYKEPDYYFEIDIEIYNQKNGDYFLTTYANGDKVHEYFGVFPFDPTAGFHNYRFDYYPDRLDYYVDGRFIVRYTNGYPQEPMHLIVNSWYPRWVPGGPASEDRYFLADWIRY
jgi:hypothetical protein